MRFKVDLCTLKYQQYFIETDKLSLPASDGRRTLLSNHMPIVLSLETGVIETAIDEKLSHYCINGGVAYFENNFAKVLSRNIVDVAELDLDELKKQRSLILNDIEQASNQYRKVVAQRKLAWIDCQLKAYQKYRYF